MLEVNRNLYLKEPSYEKSKNFNKIQEIIKGYIDELKTHFN